MHKTMSEKILADHAGKPEVFPDELVEVQVDFALGNDITAPLANRGVPALRGKKGFRPGPGLSCPGSLRAQQGYRLGRAGPNAQGFCKGVRPSLLFRSRPDGGRTRSFARTGPGFTRGRGDRSRQPHLHLRRAWRLCNRCWEHRSGRRNDNRQGLVQDAPLPEVFYHGKLRPWVGEKISSSTPSGG